VTHFPLMRIVLGIAFVSVALLLAVHAAGSAYDVMTLPTRFHLAAYKRDQWIDVAINAVGSAGCFMAARQCFTRVRREVPTT
jgi:hypothetical protein